MQLLLLWLSFAAMFNKRKLDDAYMRDLPLEKRFREDLREVFVKNELSGARTSRLVHNAALAGAQHLESLQVNLETKNTNRDLLRKTFRNSKWPRSYVFKARVWNAGKNIVEKKSMSMLLPREILVSLLKVNKAETLLQHQRAVMLQRTDLQQHQCKLAAMGFKDAEDILLTSIWADAVPFNRDRSQSLEVITWSIIGQGSFRVPLACFPKCFCRKHETYEDCFQILQWSFRHLLANICPCSRHDGTSWMPNTDASRKKLQGKPIGLTEALCELKGDWAFFKEALDVPSWSSAGRICWKCTCRRADLKKFDSHSLSKCPAFSQHVFFRWNEGLV